MTALDYTDMAEHIGVAPESFTQHQKDSIDSHLAAITGALSRALNRPLDVKEYAENLYVTEAWGRPELTQSPVVEILEVKVNSVAQALGPGYLVTVWPSLYWGYGTNIWVRYLAGIDPSTDDHIRGVLLDKAYPWVVAMLARDVVKAGGPDAAAQAGLLVPAPPPGVSGFSVEGLNVTWTTEGGRVTEAVNAAQALANANRWLPEELDGLGLSRLRKRVIV